MQSIPLENGPVQITGAYDFDRRESGIRPRRLPDWTRIQVQEFTEAMVTMGSGIRLEFVTDSDCIQLEVMQTRLDLGGVPNAVYDLEIDQGEPVSVQAEGGNLVVMDIKSPAGFRLQHGEASTVVFKDLGNQMKQCALWIPAKAQVELRSLNISIGASISAVPESDRPKWVHHGSSISHCMEASQPTGTWPVVAARLANVNVINLGLGGACHLDQYVARTMRDTPTDFLSLKAGINIVNGDTLRERTFAPALHGFIDTIREGQPDTPFLIISPIYSPPHEKSPGRHCPEKIARLAQKQDLMKFVLAA
jgi:hypothetical protein